MLRTPERVRALDRRVTKAREALESGSSYRDEKVRILDIAERVSDDIAAEQDAGDDAEAVEERFKDVQELVWNWWVGTILLGSGAESLNASDRQSLTKLMMMGADGIIHSWKKLNNEIPYDEVKTRIKEDRRFQDSLEIKDDRDFQQAVESFVDLIEFIGVSGPLTRIVGELMDVAKNGVIGVSLLKTLAEGVIEALVKGLWLSSIDSAAGKSVLIAAIAELPDARVLRAALTSMLITRVKWQISESATQHVMLDAAASLIAPLNRTFDKGEIMRFVNKANVDRASTDRIVDD